LADEGVGGSRVKPSEPSLLKREILYLPYEFVQVEHVEIIQGLLAIPAAKDVKEVAHLVAGVRCPATEI
jgi:hypothetical protein